MSLFRARRERKRIETALVTRLEEDLKIAAQRQKQACQSTIASASNLHKAVQANAVCREEAVECLKTVLTEEHEEEEHAAVEKVPAKSSGLRKTQPLNTLNIQGQSA
jgi:hypothetical protein